MTWSLVSGFFQLVCWSQGLSMLYFIPFFAPQALLDPLRKASSHGAVPSANVWLAQGVIESVIVFNSVGPQWSASGQPRHRPPSFSFALLSSSHDVVVHSCYSSGSGAVSVPSIQGHHGWLCRLSTAQGCLAEGTRKGSNTVCIPHAKL